MARNNLCRLFSSSFSNVSIRSESVMTRSSLNSLSQMMMSSSSQQQQAEETAKKKDSEKTQDSETGTGASKEVEDDDELDVNKETGEVGGPKGPEPTRYGDWERNGRCSDF